MALPLLVRGIPDVLKREQMVHVIDSASDEDILLAEYIMSLVTLSLI